MYASYYSYEWFGLLNEKSEKLKRYQAVLNRSKQWRNHGGAGGGSSPLQLKNGGHTIFPDPKSFWGGGGGGGG